MSCPACGHQNPADSRFCFQCGAPVTRRCPQCRAALPAGIRFCNQCGARADSTASDAAAQAPAAYTPKHLAEKILSSRAALEGERKQVTVLFADVKGSMELAEEVDPEVFHHVMERFAALLAEGVHRFEGTVTQFTGDGVMALFGAPIAHEDHAQRACWAALHLRDALRRYADQLRVSKGLNFSVRMGLNSGEVVVGKIGDDLRMDYTALGLTVGLAQRMEQLAEAGRVYLAGPTAASVEGFFRLRDVGPLVVKGTREPVRVFELEGPGAHRTRLDVARTRGLTRFVGRDRELEVLDAALERAAAGQRQVVGIVAEPGVGKSRVCYEFAEGCRAREIRVVEGHGVPHGRAVPLLPWIEVFRSTYRISEQDDDETARNKIAGRMLRLDPDLGDALPVMFEFLGVQDPKQLAPRMSPEALQHQLVLLAKRISHARARQRELGVYVFEDIHWFDAASDGLLAAVCEAVHATNSLIVCTFRPEYHGPWMEKSYYQQIALLPLGPEALDDLLRDLLGDDPSLADLPVRIRERTAGNPFFAEEIVHALAESGVLAGSRRAYRLLRPAGELVLPPTVQAVLAARIDHLPEREKAVLQTAAVIGKEFAEPVLRRVAELGDAELTAALQALAAAELFYEAAPYPEVEYAFKHPLTQEVAYRSQLAERRARAHAGVARAIEEVYAGKLDERAALVAHHWEAAGEALAAANWHRRAAEWVGARDRGEMSRHWQRVRALLDAVPESSETLAIGVVARTHLLQNGTVLGQADDEAAELFNEGMALARRLDSPAPRIFLLGACGSSRLASGAMDEGLAHLSEGCRLADQSGNTVLQFIARGWLASALPLAGQLREAVAVSDEVERLCGGDPELAANPGHSPFGAVLTYRAVALAWLGRLGEAAATAGRAIEVARQRQYTEVLVLGHLAGELGCELAGDLEGALGHGRQAVEAAATTSWATRMAALATLGRAHLLARDWLHAVEAMTGALAIMRERRVALVFEGWYLAVLAEASLGAGDPGSARETAELALARARQSHTPVFQIVALLAWARVRRATDGAEGATGIEAALRGAMALVEATGARGLAPFIHVERAALAHLFGDETTRQHELREAHRLFTEMGATGRAEQVAKELRA